MRVNSISRARRRTAVGLSVAALTVGAATAAGPAVAQPKAAPAAAAACSAAYRIEQKLSTGTTWRMCWHYESEAGLVLENISYQPKGEARPITVLTSAKLAQIHVPYDDGKVEYDDLTGSGFGHGPEGPGPRRVPRRHHQDRQGPGRLDPAHPNVKGLCTTTRSRGHAYRMQGDTANKVYQHPGQGPARLHRQPGRLVRVHHRVALPDDGTINMNVGATGSLSPGDYDAGDGRGWPIGKGAKAYATSHSHNVFWRLNFGLDGSSKNKVEQYDSVVSPPAERQRGPDQQDHPHHGHQGTRGRRQEHALVARRQHHRQEQGRARALVRDRPGRHHQVPGPQLHQARHLLHRVQASASSSPATTRPTAVPEPVSPSTSGSTEQTLTHPVAWVNVGFHHIARDEDQQPMPVHWQGFSIAPRDVTAMNPLTPPALADQNGQVGKR